MSKPTTLKLLSSDNQRFELDVKAAEKSRTLLGVMIDYEENSDIPLSEITSEILAKVIEYLNNYKDKQPKDIPKPLPTPNLKDVLDAWDYNFITGFEINTIFDLINAANYLDIAPLLDLACSRIAAEMKGKTAEEIRAMFNLECDLSEEEIKEYEEFQI